MSPNKKAAPKSAPAKAVSSPKAAAKPANVKNQAKAEKAGKASDKELKMAPPVEGAEVDVEELEEEADMASFRASSSGSDSSAALATAATGTETSLSFKNFRHHPEMENFYRFIYENDLRFEALSIIDVILTEKRNARRIVKEKTMAH